MRNNLIKITLIVALTFVLAVPAHVLAMDANNSQADRTITSKYSEIYNDFFRQFSGFGFQNPMMQPTSQPTRSDKQITQETQAPAAPTEAIPQAAPAPTQVAPQEPPTQAAAPAPAANYGAYEQQVVDLVNKERAAAGLPSLKVNSKLSGVAEKKAEDLRDQNYFAHQSPTYGSPFDMMKQFGISYTAAGENIARGQRTPESVMDGWMNSPGHKANILNSSFTEIGVGYVTDSRGTTYWV